MSLPWMDPPLVLLGTVSVGGTVLGLLGLLRSFSASRPPAGRILAAVAGVVVAFAAVALAFGQPWEIWLSPLLLLGVCLAFRGLQTDRGRRLWAGFCTPRCQAACLLVCGPAFAVGWFLHAP